MWGYMTAFHGQLTKCFLLNLLRAILVLMVAVLAFNIPSFEPGLSAFLFLCLSILELVLPSALLVAALFTVGSLARNHELTALKAAGWSMLKILWPVVLVGVVSVPISVVLREAGLANHLSEQSNAATQTAVHANRAYPLANLLAVIIGISLAATPRQKSTFVGFIRAALVLGAYYVVSATAGALGRHGGFPPFVAGWFGTGVFACISGVLWWKAE